MKNTKVFPSIKTYEMRSGRLTKSQRSALVNLFPIFGIEITSRRKLNLSKIFGNDNPIIIEFGFGNGKSLVENASNHPDKNYLGIEVHLPGVGQILTAIKEHNINNLRVIKEDGVFVLENCIKPESIARVQVYFPDPWPKRRHAKRRLLQAPFAKTLSKLLQPKGELHIATDWQPYALHCLDVLRKEKTLANLNPLGSFVKRPESRPKTKFEKRGLKLGHPVADIIYVKKDLDG